METKHKKPFHLFFLFLTIILSSTLSADNWLKWRGPNGNGISTEIGWNPMALNNGAKIKWQIKLGRGYSSVTVQDDKLYTMGNQKDKDIVYCLDVRTGKEIWKFTYNCKNRNYNGSFSTPVIDDNRVYTISRNGDVYCLNSKTGKKIWFSGLIKKSPNRAPKYGYSCSPVIFKNQIILNAGKNGVSLDKFTGKPIWSSLPGKAGYATPVLYKYNGYNGVVIFSHRKLNGVNPKTGKLLWSFPWVFNDGADSPDPVVVNNKVFISTAYRNGAAVIDFSNNKAKQKWFKKDIQDEFGSSIYKNGFLYVPHGDTRHRTAYLKCINFHSGKEMWSRDTEHCSLIYVDKKFIVLNQWGLLTIMQADEKGFKDLSSAKIIKTSSRVRCWTAPVLSNGNIYIRTNVGDLVCVDVSA